MKGKSTFSFLVYFSIHEAFLDQKDRNLDWQDAPFLPAAYLSPNPSDSLFLTCGRVGQVQLYVDEALGYYYQDVSILSIFLNSEILFPAIRNTCFHFDIFIFSFLNADIYIYIHVYLFIKRIFDLNMCIYSIIYNMYILIITCISIFIIIYILLY